MSAQTVIIEDLGNDIKFTFSNGDEITLNKLTLKTLNSVHSDPERSFVYLTDGAGFNNTDNNKVIRLRWDLVTSPVFASNDDLVSWIIGISGSVALGSSAAGGGGSSTWSTAQGDFIATPTAATTNITVTGLSWTLEAENVASIVKYDSSGNKETLNTSNVVVSGGVITLGNEDDFEVGDTVSVTLIGPDKAYDEAIDSSIVSVLNPDSAKWTSPEHLVDFSAQAADTLRYVIPMEGYADISMHWKFANTNAGDTITMTLWATNNADADDTADTDWVDVTGDLLTKTLTVTNGTIEFWEQLNNINPLKLMVKLVVVSVGDTNAADIYIKKKY